MNTSCDHPASIHILEMMFAVGIFPLPAGSTRWEEDGMRGRRDDLLFNLLHDNYEALIIHHQLHRFQPKLIRSGEFFRPTAQPISVRFRGYQPRPRRERQQSFYRIHRGFQDLSNGRQPARDRD